MERFGDLAKVALLVDEGPGHELQQPSSSECMPTSQSHLPSGIFVGIK